MGLFSINGAMPAASYAVNFIPPNQKNTTTRDHRKKDKSRYEPEFFSATEKEYLFKKLFIIPTPEQILLNPSLPTTMATQSITSKYLTINQRNIIYMREQKAYSTSEILLSSFNISFISSCVIDVTTKTAFIITSS